MPGDDVSGTTLNGNVALPWLRRASTSHTIHGSLGLTLALMPQSIREHAPDLVMLQVWGVTASAIPGALVRTGTDRLHLHRIPGLAFHKSLGTGSGRTFTTRDADPRHWALLTTWDRDTDADHFLEHRVSQRWNASSTECLVVRMRPLMSRGEWSHQRPFEGPLPTRWEGPVAAITRARIKPSMWLTFARSVPPVSADLHKDEGLMFSLGIGEAPLGLQGTFSIWRNNRAITDFAHRRSPHIEVMRRTHELGWYSEELFARFAVLSVAGSYNGHPVTV